MGEMKKINNLQVFINCLLCYITFFICYQLALAFIGVSQSPKRILFPVLIASVIGYISKICLGASAPVHTAVVVIICATLLYLYNKIDIKLSLIGSLLAVITLTLGSLILACPLLFKLGYALPSTFNELAWFFLILLELIVPTLVLIILKITRFSLIRYIIRV
jgi:hypothetical protein